MTAIGARFVGDQVKRFAAIPFPLCVLVAGWQIAALATLPAPQPAAAPPGLTRASFGTVSGQPVELFTLRNANGVEVKATNYGGIITSIVTPDRDGRPGDIVLGFDTIDGYLKNPPYFGAVVGRYGNRIAKGRFTLDGSTYTLAINNGPNHLHGGLKGFDKVVWKARAVDRAGMAWCSHGAAPTGKKDIPATSTCGSPTS